MSSTAAPAPAASIISPVVDLLCVGGLSLILFVPLLLSGRTDLVIIGAGAQAWLATLINMPHFMASYRVVYRDRAMIMKHKWATLFIPSILLVYIAAAIWEAQSSTVLFVIIVVVSSAYLAWHYTGQVWGMMASYAYLAGTKFERREKLLIRTSLRILLAWHVTWFVYTYVRDPSMVRPAYVVISAGTAVAFALGLIGLWMMWRRTGVLPPARALVAWVAIFVWYAVVARDPKAIFWIQIAHAIQYLSFPIRVEINRTAGSIARSTGKLAGHMAVYAAVLLGVSVFVAMVVPGPAMSAVANVFGEQPGKMAPVLILMFINIHHYFTDGVIWKISNPEVRQELFAHVRREAPAKPVVVPANASPVGRTRATRAPRR